jgi:hypothetical protein
VDAFDPAYSLPAGLQVGADGKCKRARSHHEEVSIDDAGNLVVTRAAPTGTTLREMGEEALGYGEPIESATPEVTGPASKTGTPSTTTSTPSGGETTTTTKTQTVNYSYAGDTITYNIVTVTNTTVGGTTTTTTETEAPQEDDQCKANPDTLGCMKLGQPPEDQPPQWQTRDVPWAAESLGLGAGCPADVSWTLFPSSHSIAVGWSYQPVCEVAGVIRLALLAIAGIGAIAVVIKETT